MCCLHLCLIARWIAFLVAPVASPTAGAGDDHGALTPEGEGHLDQWNALRSKLTAMRALILALQGGGSDKSEVLECVADARACNVEIASVILNKISVRQVKDLLAKAEFEAAVLSTVNSESASAKLAELTFGQGTPIGLCVRGDSQEQQRYSGC